jgi:hypothetical protein
MIADVQRWLDDPGANHGWLVRGNEVDAQSFKGFASRENADPTLWPSLLVEFQESDDDDESGEDDDDDSRRKIRRR